MRKNQETPQNTSLWEFEIFAADTVTFYMRTQEQRSLAKKNELMVKAFLVTSSSKKSPNSQQAQGNLCDENIDYMCVNTYNKFFTIFIISI